MIPKAYVYADPNESEFDLPGARINFFYMHGEAEARTGYDCCNGNIETLRMCMRAGAFIAMLEFPDGTEELCIVNSKFSQGHMSGLIALLSDIDAIKFVFANSEYYPSMYEDEKEFLKENYPKVRETIIEIVKNFDNKKSRVPKRILTEEEVKEKFTHYLTVGGLKKSIERLNLTDEAKVVIQRVEDVYYNKHGWGVMLKEGEHYHNAIHMNKNMKEEIARRERGEEPEYPKMDDPIKYIFEDEVLKELKEQYNPAWGVVEYKDKDFLFIDLHY
jgi:hypothetical protein